ncbi:hypothetical protein [Nitrospira sp. Nam74]
MENFVSIALLLIVKVAERPQAHPVQLQLSPPEDLHVSPHLRLAPGSGATVSHTGIGI